MPDATTRAIVEAALDGIVMIDAEGRIVDFNRAAERIFGHARDRAWTRAGRDPGAAGAA